MENPFNELNERLERIEELLVRLIQSKLDQNFEEETILNVQEAADFLQESKATLYARTSRREIPFYKRGKRIYFKKVELMGWLEEGKKSTCYEGVHLFEKKK